MNVRRLVTILVFFLSISFLFPKTSKAFDLQESLSSENSIFFKLQEGLEYFFAFSVESKVAVLDGHAEKRLVMAGEYAEEGNNERVQSLMRNYLQIKERQNDLLDEVDGNVLGAAADRTIEQQKTMEEIKTKIDEGTKGEVVEVQEQVVNQIAQRIVVVNGPEGQNEFFGEVGHVWAPGTGPGGDVGITIEGGGSQYAPGTTAGGSGGVVVEGGTIQFAPGTSAGGPSGSDIKTTEIKTGGGENNVVEGGSEGGLAPGTTQGGTGGNTIDPGSVDPGTSENGDTWLAP